MLHREIAAALGITPSAVSYHLKHSEGYENWRELTDEKRAIIVREYTAGKTMDQICAELRSCRSTIIRVLREAGVASRPKTRDWSGDKNPKWNGGVLTHEKGYKYIYLPDHPDAIRMGYVFEHRLVMEKKLGRRLSKKEVVHHINGVVTDNRPENLEIFSSNAEHLKATLTGVPHKNPRKSKREKR